MANLYHLGSLPAPGEATLDGDVAHHLLRVLRVREGDEVTLADGAGRTARATVRAAQRRELVVDVEAPRLHVPLPIQVTLAFACPRPARADWLIEHGTEVGVAAFQPVWTARSRPQTVRVERWRKLANAAAGQCARPFLPEVREPVELDALLTGALPETRLLAAADGAPAGPARAGDALCLVGPEGGFTDEERQLAVAASFTPVRLGPHILRTETAALVAAATLLGGA